MWPLILRSWVYTLIHGLILLMKKTSFEYYCFIFEKKNNILRIFPPTSGQEPPNSGSFDWQNCDLHKTYTCIALCCDHVNHRNFVYFSGLDKKKVFFKNLTLRIGSLFDVT